MSVVTSTPLLQSYFIADLAAIAGTYNRIRWYRSRSGSDGGYEAATASAIAAATMLGTSKTPHQLNGMELKLKLNGITEVTVVFSDADPVTTSQAAAEINGASSDVVATDDDGYLRLTTVATGSGASIEVLESEAAPYLGLLIGDGAVGLNADTSLASGVSEYFFNDQNSDDDFWYQVEFRSTITGAVSDRTVAQPGTKALAVPKSESVMCFVRLAGLDGSPLCGRTLSVSNVATPNTVAANGLNWGVFRNHVQKTTDSNGYAATRLMRGSTVDFCIVGTGFVRRVTIPDTGDSIDLLDPALVVEDEFGIQEFNVDFLIRTS